jgi:hypothetical protein
VKFYIESLHLWLVNGRKRLIHFLPNKVNVITGDSHTGKTAILDIVDYCLFASKHRISESIINENVLWYGLRIHVNDKTYMLARRAPKGPETSDEYHFSSVGDVPDGLPNSNIKEITLKKLLSADFGIDQDVRIPFGGSVLKAGSRISLRYFLLFNTISQDIITHSEQFFDKQEQKRYQEALPRIFDIAVGIDTVENILKREKREDLEKRLMRLQKLSAGTDENRLLFHTQLAETLAKATAYGLIPDDSGVDASVETLKRMVAERESGPDLYVSVQHEKVSSELYRVSRKIRGLRKFVGEYTRHKDTLSETVDSLKPVNYLREKYNDVIRTSVFDEIIDNLSDGLQKIKRDTLKKTPLDSNISDIIKGLEARRKELQGELEALPTGLDDFESSKDKFIFLGETKAKLEMFGGLHEGKSHDYNAEIAVLETQIGELEVLPAIERQEQFTNVLDEAIQDYIELTKTALGNYGEYRSAFNYKEKKLHLRKPKTVSIENVGSSSNHMFLHLFLFLGLHELVMRNDGIHVAPFLIIDQFSRPYWGDDDDRGAKSGQGKDVNQSDVSKVKLALNLLNEFIGIANNLGKEFQIILFEHIDKKYWDGLDNFHLVETFRDGNALIPTDDVNV